MKITGKKLKEEQERRLKTNKEKFWTGLGMTVFPFLVWGIKEIAEEDINWGAVGVVTVGLAYFGVALYLMIKGAVQEE